MLFKKENYQIKSNSIGFYQDLEHVDGIGISSVSANLYNEKRDDIRKELTDNEIGSAIYYETPIHKQPIYEEFGYKLPNSEKFSKEIMSLPSYPQLTDEQALEICECVNKIIS